MTAGGGSAALKGFVYQFLHTLMELMGESASTRVRATDATESSGNGQGNMLIQIEGVEDLSVQFPSSRRLYQLKDRAKFGPEAFAGEVLKRFAQEYREFTESNPEFVLFTSKTLDGSFYGPFRALCDEARLLREKGSIDDGVDLSLKGVLKSDPLEVPEAAAWAIRCSKGGKPIGRGLKPTQSVKVFLAWLLRCLFVKEAGITSEVDLLDFLSRIEIDDGHEWRALRSEVLEDLEDRLPQKMARARLREALGGLAEWAARRGGQWVEADVLLKELRIPPALSWGTVFRGCAESRAESPGQACPQEETSRAVDDVASYVRLWLEMRDTPLFLLATVGYMNTGGLIDGISSLGLEKAPIATVDCSYDDQEIVWHLLRMAGWERAAASDWLLPDLAEHLQSSADRPPERPSMVLLVDGFSGSEEHAGKVSRWLRYIGEADGYVLLVAERAALRMLELHVAQQWAGLTWQPVPSRRGVGDDEEVLITRLLSPIRPDMAVVRAGSERSRLEGTPQWIQPSEPEEPALEVATRKIAGNMKLLAPAVTDALDAIARTAILEAPGSGAVRSGLLAGLPQWCWASRDPAHLPEAAIDQGLFRRSGENLLLVSTSVTVALVERCIASMDFSQIAEFSGRLAQTPLTSDVVFGGFVLWLSEFVRSGPDESGLLDVLRPWAADSHWQWTPYVFEQAGRAALGPLRVLAEELAGQLPDDHMERYRVEAQLRKLLELARATGAPELADWALDWAQDSDGEWLRPQIMSFFARETGETGSEALLDELRNISEGVVPE